MADTAEQTPVEETPTNVDIEMEDGGEGAAGDDTILPDLEVETPKVVTFLE